MMNTQTPLTSRSVTTRYSIALLTAFSMLALLAGCESTSRSNESVDFFLESSHDTVYVGETVTVWANSSNTVGREPEIEWSTTGGDLDEIRNGSAAQVKFDTPGTYQVSAKLELENGVDRMGRVSVNVKQLP